MKTQIYWSVLIFILFIIETPLLLRFIRYNKQFELTKQVAVTILMILAALIIWGIGNLGLILIKFVIR